MKLRMIRGLTTVVVVAACAVLAADPADLRRAEELYRRTDYEGAIKLAARQTSAASHFLSGRSHFMLGDFKKAIEQFEKAIAAEPANSVYHHWLGRSWGRRAETSSVFTAPAHASKARASFEKAVELDPRNLEAINDLFVYYLEAPGFMGGGFDKASQLAERIRLLDPVEHHYALAQLAEKRKEFNTAEQQLRRAAELAPRHVGRVVDLAKFLAKQGKVQESEAAFRQAESIAPNDPKVMFERAATYIRTGRNLETARALLKKYLEAPLTPDHPTRAEAERLLKQAGG